MSLISHVRRLKIIEHLKFLDAMGVVGDVLEVGVYRGGSLLSIAQNTTRAVTGVDTFEGMPEPDKCDIHTKGNYSDTSLEQVQQKLKDYKHVKVIKGQFPWAYWPPSPLALAHLDVDIYPSVKDSLDRVIKCMGVGGIIVIDDYAAPSCPGALKATHEFLGLHATQVKVISIVECQLSLRVV